MDPQGPSATSSYGPRSGRSGRDGRVPPPGAITPASPMAGRRLGPANAPVITRGAASVAAPLAAPVLAGAPAAPAYGSPKGWSGLAPRALTRRWSGRSRRLVAPLRRWCPRSRLRGAARRRPASGRGCGGLTEGASGGPRRARRSIITRGGPTAAAFQARPFHSVLAFRPRM